MVFGKTLHLPTPPKPSILAKPSIPIPKPPSAVLSTVAKGMNNPLVKGIGMATPIGAVAVGAKLAIDHKDEIKNTLGKAGHAVAKEVKTGTTIVAREVKEGAQAVGNGAKAVGHMAGNMMTYAMIGVGGIVLVYLLVKF